MPRRTKVLLTIVAALALLLPIWQSGISPRVFSTAANVVLLPSGTLVKAWGEADCLNNGMPTVVLRPDGLGSD